RLAQRPGVARRPGRAGGRRLAGAVGRDRRRLNRHIPIAAMQNPPPIPELLNELAAFRDFAAALLTEADRDWNDGPTPDEWSLTEIACHMRDVEREVHQSRLRALLREEGAFLPGVDADEWAGPRRYREQNGRVALAEFLDARDETIALLAPLPDDVWARRGQHTF